MFGSVWFSKLDRYYGELRRNKWLRRFSVFCRVALAFGFIPAGLVKIRGERFTGLPSNNPLGHYFDALYLTGYYYTFIGVCQWIAAVLLLIPRTALVGAIFYFPIILNIFVLTHATRFDGTRIVALMLLANIFLLAWDADRLKHVVTFPRPVQARQFDETGRFPWLFFACVFAMAASVIVFNDFLFDIRPGNEEAECTNDCKSRGNPDSCLHFCDCIWKQGRPLNPCLNEFRKERQTELNPAPSAR